MPPEYSSFFKLFNQQQYFEAHEALEILWQRETGEPRRFYQALIQIAAVFVHLQKGNVYGAKNLYQKAQEHFKGYPDLYYGVSIPKVLRDVAIAIQNKNATYRMEVEGL